MLKIELTSLSAGVDGGCKLSLILGLVLLLVVPAWGGSKSKDEETLRNASTVLTAMLDSNSVPTDLLARAYCVVVLPDVKKFGLVGARDDSARRFSHVAVASMNALE